MNEDLGLTQPIILPGQGEVHVWQINHNSPPNFRTATALRAISPAELEEMCRYFRKEDRDRFLMRKFRIRRIIAGYFSASPVDIQIHKTPTGKPLLYGFGDIIHAPRLEISISHSRDLTILAISTWAPIGIDIEYKDPSINPEDLFRFCCSKKEQEWFTKAPDRLSFFLRLWTAKEACLKLSGTGLSVDPRNIECWPGPSNSFTVEWRDGSFGPCRVLPVSVEKDYIASLAVMPGYSKYWIQSDSCFANP